LDVALPGGFGKRWAEGVDRPGDTLGTLTTVFSGLALGFNAAHEPDGVSLILIATTPVDAQTRTCSVRSGSSERRPTTCRKLRAPARVAKAALPDDVNIWATPTLRRAPAAHARRSSRLARAAALDGALLPARRRFGSDVATMSTIVLIVRASGLVRPQRR